MSGIALHMSSPSLQKVTDEARARGARLAAARDLRGLDQAELAKKLKVSRQTISGWENGAEISEKWMVAIARVLKANRGWLRYGEGQPPEGLVARQERERLTHPSEQEPSLNRKKG